MNKLLFIKTEKQCEATRLMSGNERHVMLFGGGRAGKTAIIIRNIIIRASKEPNSRHGVFRKHFNALKTSILLDTFPKVMKLAFPDLPYKLNKTDYYVTLPNGSEIWFCGLDDEKRVEKVLGKEFSTLYFNECSEIDYFMLGPVYSRLAQKNRLKKKIYYDMNPPPKSHWTYWVFIKKINPRDSEPLKNPDDYCSMLMNPADNIENIDQEYLEFLNSLSEKEKNRFLLGLFSDDSDGQVYYAFDRERHVKEFNHADLFGTTYLGQDFNVEPMTGVAFKVANNTLYVYDEQFLQIGDSFKAVDDWKKRGFSGATVIPDSTGANRKTSGKSDHLIFKEAGFTVASVFNPAVQDRVNNMNYLLSCDRIIIHPRCKKLINDLERVVWKNGELSQKGADKMLTHISDALGYGAWKLMPLQKQNQSRTIQL